MGNGTKYATTTATQSLPSYLSDAYKNIVGSATQTGTQPYQPYTGGFSQDQQTAFKNIGDLYGASNPMFSSSTEALNAAMVPTSERVSQYMSPYLSGVVAPMMANMQEQNAQGQQQVLGNAVAKGAMGGNRVGVAQAELARKQKLADNQALGELYHTGYTGALSAAQADKQAALDAARGYSDLGATQMQTALSQTGAQLGAGTQQQQFDYQQYLNELAFPYQQQSWLASIMGGLAPTAGGTTTQQNPQGNLWSQLFGGLLGVGSMFNDGGRVHAASGGVMGHMPYANDNDSPFPSYITGSGSIPYSNDNGSFMPYVPGMVAIGGADDFPTIEAYEEPPNPWMSPRRADGGVVGYAPGGKVMTSYTRSRGSVPGRELTGPMTSEWLGPIDQIMYREPATATARLPANSLPPANYGTSTNFVPDATVVTRTRGVDGMISPPLPGFETEAPPSRSVMAPRLQEPTIAYAPTAAPRAPQSSGVVTAENLANNTGWGKTVDTLGGAMSRTPIGRIFSKLAPDAWNGLGQGFKDWGNQRAQVGRAKSISSAPWVSGGKPRAYVDRSGSDSGVLGANALMPTTSMSGGARRMGEADGGVVGRRGYAGGGITQEELDEFYGGASNPGTPFVAAGADDGRMMPAPVLAPAPVAEEVFEPLAYSPTPDDMGMNGPPVDTGSLRPFDGGVGVPFTTGDQFTTAPAPGYSQNIGDAFRSVSEGNGLNLAPDMRQALLAAGMGMMSSRSPFALQGIGEGGLKGIETWNARQQLERENAAQRAANATSGAGIVEALERAGLTRAAAGRERQATSIDQWNMTPTMAGMMVTDKVDPSRSYVIPFEKFTAWMSNPTDPGAMSVAEPTPRRTEEGTRFDVPLPADAKPSNMGFTESGQQIVTGQTSAVLNESRVANQAAEDASLQLAAMRHAADNLPASGPLAPGAWAEARGGIAKSLNTLAAIAGLELPFDPSQIGSIEEMNKLTTQFGFNLARTTGADIAASVIQQGVGAVPSIENTPQGFRAITSLIQASLNRTRDYNVFLQKWAARTGGDTTGASVAFNRLAPPSLYSDAAIMDSAIVPKTQAEIDNAPAGTLFNIDGQLMVK